jgi:hypothetical protein
VPGPSTVIRAVSVSSWQNRWSVPAVDLPSVVASSPIAGVVSAGDPGSSRLVYAMVIGLVVVGVGLILLAVWILRQTRPDLDVLAPLERMGDGDWKKRDPSTQRRMLDEVRPEGAQPLAAEPPPPPIDSDFGQADHEVASFSDLGPGLGGGAPTPTSGHTDADGSDDEADQSTDEPVDDAPDEPVDEPVEESDDQPVEVSDVEPVEVSDDEPVEESDVELLDEPGDGPIDESPEEPGDTELDDQVEDALGDPRG